MRISDWSSDVCSSDLLEEIDGRHLAKEAQRQRIGDEHVDAEREQHHADIGAEPHQQIPSEHRGEVEHEAGDRKSVVEGKSVSVGVDHGGRRIIKKKNNITNNHSI